MSKTNFSIYNTTLEKTKSKNKCHSKWLNKIKNISMKPYQHYNISIRGGIPNKKVRKKRMSNFIWHARADII